MQFNVFNQDTVAGAYCRLQHLSARISDNKGGQRYEEERKKQSLWNCSACFCSLYIQLLTLSFHPYDLQRESTSLIVAAVYIPQ